MTHFEAGDLVLVGPYLPHLWRNDPSYYSEGEYNSVNTIVIKFNNNFLGEGAFDNPEFSDIKNLLSQSKSSNHSHG